MTTSANVRLALVNCSGLLGEILSDAVRAQSDFTVVADLEDAARLVEAVHEVRPDVVLWNNADETALSGSVDYFGFAPALKVLATLGDGRDASLWQLRPHRTPLGQLSPTTLVSTIREAAAR